MSDHAHHPDDPHATIDTPGATHDPVCGHWVNPALAHGRSTYEGVTIHFCSAACKRAFDAAPTRFFPRYQRHPAAPVATPPSVKSAMPRASPMGFLDKIRPASPPGSALDPVCHMTIDPAKAAGKSDHAGQTYYFCSPGCKKKFDTDPHKYLGAHSHGGHEGHMH